MKKLLLFIGVFWMFSGCNISEDCIKKSGSMTTKSIEATPFDKIIVNPGVGLVVTQGTEYSITVKAGSNFIDDVSAKIEGDRLVLKDNSGCNLVRDYGQVTVYVSAPSLSEIYTNSEQPIKSDGVLSYPILRLYSTDNFGGTGTSDFTMQVNTGQLVIESNNISSFYIAGNTGDMLLNFYDGLGRFEGGDLLANTIEVFQRGANDMIVHPVESITGNIYSTGDIISKNHPPTVNVVEHYSGKLIFN